MQNDSLPPSRLSLPPSSDARRSTLPQPVLRRIAAMIDNGVVGRAPPSLQMLGRVLLHAAAVGAAVGFVCLLFVEGLELTQHFVLEGLTGYLPLRAAGEGDVVCHATGTYAIPPAR